MSSKIRNTILISVAVALAVIVAVVVAVVVINKEKNKDKTPAPKAVVWDGVTTVAPVGAGTISDPYVIASPENLAYMSTQESASEYRYYTLVADLDMGGHDWTPIGNSGNNVFRGEFKGNLHTIKNLGEDKAGYYSSASKPAPSLFGVVDGAVINGVTVEYAFEEVSGTSAFGGIVREASGSTIIVGCANITDRLEFNNCNTIDTFGIGGLVGCTYNYTTIETSYCMTSIEVNGTKANLGGLVGVVNAFSVGEGEKMYPKLKDSYYAGRLTENVDEINIGNIVGKGYSTNVTFSLCEIENVFSVYDVNSNVINSFTNWSSKLSNNWVIDPDVNNNYPTVKQTN